MTQVMWVAIGGALGSVMRYLMHKGSLEFYAGDFPLGTFFVNILGAGLIGFVWAYISSTSADESVRALVIIGMLGGFTTFSSFALETMNLLNFGMYGMATLYVLSSNIIGLAAVFAGFKAYSLL